ncbi:MAG: replication initiator protein [Microvirus sp.]|nr:MAG: replication initiator protein [Microvirus sp.]
MACYHPIPAYSHGPCGTVDLWPPLGEENLNLPCGACLGCRTDRALDWAHRAVHEAQSWANNCFLTLTYNDESKPSHGELIPGHLRDFLKRLRRYRDYASSAVLSDRGASLRYLACGEYGEQHGRPHYHLCLFNCDFSDKYEVAKNLAESPALAKLWTFGNHRLGTLTAASANYVAQYTIKKQGTSYCSPDGELLPPPFLRMSLKPAIGTKWLIKNQNDLLYGYLVTEGNKGRIPRTYKTKLVSLDPAKAEQIAYLASKAPRTRNNLVAAEAIHMRRVSLAALQKGR